MYVQTLVAKHMAEKVSDAVDWQSEAYLREYLIELNRAVFLYAIKAFTGIMN